MRLRALLGFVSLAGFVVACAKAKPPEDPLKGIKTGCSGAVYAPPADAKTRLEVVVENRLPKGSFGPLHACVLVDEKPLVALDAATASEIANATALHLVATVTEGKHAVRIIVSAIGVAEWAGYAWDTAASHDVEAKASVTSTVTVFGKSSEQPKDMVVFEWKDSAPPPPPIATGQVLDGPGDAGPPSDAAVTP